MTADLKYPAAIDAIAGLGDSFADFIETHPATKLFFDPLNGNHGDSLILMGANRVLEAAPQTIVDDIDAADVIVINGGGAMNDIWKVGPERIRDYRTTHPDKPIIIGPSSFFFEKTDFKALCSLSKAPITLWSREKYSVDHLLKFDLPEHVTLRLGHDFAFALAGSELIENLKNDLREKHLLVAMRGDREAAGKLVAKIRLNALPQPIKAPLLKIREVLIKRKTQAQSQESVGKLDVQPDIPTIHEDLSLSGNFENFCDKVAHAKSIVTNRLHISILGYLLGKPVSLIPGNYHKIRGVCEWTMSHEGSTVRLESE
jgi:exopolysaccharide biosynthesis predicted pyruvyltransferase EpsI